VAIADKKNNHHDLEKKKKGKEGGGGKLQGTWPAIWIVETEDLRLSSPNSLKHRRKRYSEKGERDGV